MSGPYTMQEIIDGLGLVLEPEEPEPERSAPSGNGDKKFRKGRRHEGVKRVAMHLRNAGLPGDRLLALLLEENERRCSPPLSQAEVESIARWFADKKSATEAMVKPVPRVELVTFREIMARDIPAVAWIVWELLCEGLTVLAGSPKIGKSWFVMALSIAVALGTLALGKFRVNRGAVLHLALEDNERRFRSRLSMLLGDDPPPESAFFASKWLPFTDNPNDASGLDMIHDWLLDHKNDARLVVVDTLARVRPRGRSDDLYSRDYAALEGLQRLAADFGVAIIVVHHTNKGQHADEYNQVSGTTGLTGAADTVMLMTRPKRVNADATLFVSGRDIEERTGCLEFNRQRGLWTWTGDAAEIAMSRERRRIIEVMRVLGKPVGATEIMKNLGETKSRQAIAKLLMKMCETNEVRPAAGQTGKFVLYPG